MPRSTSTTNRFVRAAGALVGGALALTSTAVATLAAASPTAASPAAAAATTAFRMRAIDTYGGPGHAGLYAWGAATMRDGSVLISDYWNLRVQRFAADGTPLGIFSDNGGHGPDQHFAVYGMAVDPVNGDVYLADTDKYQIDHYREDGTYVGSFGSQGTGPGKFRYPSRVAVGPDQRVYVADTWDNRISVHEPDGTELFDWGGGGSADGRINQPRGIAFDDEDRLYVADHGNKEIDVFAADGTWLRTIGTAGTGPAQIQGDLRGLAVDGANDLVYLVDGVDDQIMVFSTDGTFVREFGETGSGPGQFLDGAREITLDGNGNLWVSDLANYRVQVFAPDGTFLFARPDPPAPPPDGGFNGPRGMAVDTAGNVFVADTYNQRIQKLAPDGTFVTAWGSRGRDEYAFNYPRMIAVDPRNGDVLVADTDNHQIKRYTNDGAHVWTVGGQGGGDGQFRNPHGVDVGSDGTIAIADSNNDRVVILAEDGGFVRAFGGTGSGDGQFLFPRGVGFGPDGTVWVADSNRDDVQHFAADGTWLGAVGSGEVGAAQLHRPFDVEVDADRVYVASTSSHEVKVFAPDGTVLGVVGGQGSQIGQLNQPDGLDLGPDGDLYVAEEGNDRVTRFTARELTSEGTTPELVDQFGGPGHADVYPSGMETLDDGGLVVADTGNGLVKRYDGAGTLLWTAGQRDSGLGQIEHPRDVAVDPATGSVYVADGGTSRIVVYDADGLYRFAFSGPSTDPIGAAMGVSIANNLLFVADGAKRKVRVFNLVGAQVREVTSTGDCVLDQVRDVAADETNNLYVANYLANNILKVSLNGTCLGSWGTRGTADGQFRNPYGVTVRLDPVSGVERVYVADSNNNRIQVFSKSGAHLATLGGPGEFGTPGTFTALRRVAVAPDGDVWGADLWGTRLERFDRTATGWQPAQSIGAHPPGLASDAVFNQVRGMAVGDGELLAVDTVNQRFVRFDAATGELLGACGERGFAEIGGFNWPRGLAVDPATGDVWVIDTKQNRVQVLARDCTGIARFGTFGTGPEQFDWPHAITIRASDRTAWVADTRNDRVVAYDVATRAQLAVYGTNGSGDGQFWEPRGITVDPLTDDILVADTFNGRVVRLHAEPHAADVTWGGVVEAGLAGPEAVAADANGRIYVAETRNDQVRIVDADGEVTGVLRHDFDGPAGLFVDGDSRLYVADTYHDRILRFAFPGDPEEPPDPGLTYARDLVGPGPADAYPVDVEVTADRYYVVDPGNLQLLVLDRATGEVVDRTGLDTGLDLGAARAVEVDSGGDVWLADTGLNRILHLSPDLELVDSFGVAGTGTGQFTRPYGVTLGPGDADLGDPAEVVYVADDTGRVQVFGRDGTYLRTFAGADVLDHPRQVEVHPGTGQVYVVNARQREVVVFEPDGTEVRRFGSEGTGPGQFTGDPRGIAVTATGQVYVTDANGERVVVFDDQGQPAGELGGPDDFVDPRGLTVTGDGVVVVADEWDHSVKELAGGAVTRRLLGTPPSATGVNHPRGLAVDDLGRVYVLDHWNMRVMRVNPDGTGHLTFGFRGTRSEPGSLNFPWDVAIEPGTGRVFVANREGHEIVVFDADGAFLTRWGSAGSALDELRFPTGVTFAPDGTLLVADARNDRVVRYAIDGNGDGTPIESYGQSGERSDGPGFFDELSDVAVEPDGTIWAADSFHQSVQRRDPDGTWTRFSDPDGPYREVRGLALGPDGNVWIADSSNDRLVVIDPETGTPVAIHDGESTGSGPWDFPGDVAFGPAGQVYVSDGLGDRVVELSHQVEAPADATVSTPARGDAVAAPVVELAGDATAAAGVESVDIAVQDLATRQWLQADGSFGSYVAHAAELAAPGEPASAWTFSWDGAPLGSYVLRVDAAGGDGRHDPTPPAVPFSVVDPAPAGTIDEPEAGAEVAADVVEIAGTASALAGVHDARLAIGNESTGEWYRPDGTWGARTEIPAELAAPGERETGWSFSFAPPEPAPYSVELVVTDLDGAASGEPVRRSFTTALPAPDTVVDSPTADAVITGMAVSMRGSASAPEGVAAVEVSIKDRTTGLWWQSDGTWGTRAVRLPAAVADPLAPTTAWSFDWTAPAPGLYGVRVRAVDGLGVPDPSPPWTRFSVTTSPPDGTIEAPAPGATVAGPTVTLAGSAAAADGVGTVNVAIQDKVTRQWWRSDGTWGAYQRQAATVGAPGATGSAWSFEWPDAAPGAYNVQLVVEDRFGVADPEPALHGFTVIAPEPDGTMEVPAQGGTVAESPVPMRGTATAPAGVARVQIAVKDRATNLWWQHDGSWGEFQRHDATLSSPGALSTDWTYDWPAPGSGSYAVQLQVVDADGAIDPTRVWNQFEVTWEPVPAYLSLVMARMQWQGNADCQPAAGYVSMDRVADALAARGLTATGAVVTGPTEETTRACRGNYWFASWQDLATLRDDYGWTMVSSGTDHANMLAMTPEEQEAESCGSLAALEEHGHTRGWGLFGYPNNGYSTELQENLVSTCFAFGRRYAAAQTNWESTTGPPWFLNVSPADGGNCVDATAGCPSIDHTGDGTIDLQDAYKTPERLAAHLAPEPGEYRLVQYYRFVEGAGSSGIYEWDCTNADPDRHWTSRRELYCFDDFVAALDMIPDDVTVTDPATVAEAWGRGNPNG